MKNLYFIRHGLSEMNVLGLRAGSSETPLTAEGRLQAKQAGEKAKSLKIDLIISSPQGRAIETAQIIAKKIGYPKNKILQNSLLIERNFGKLEGTPWNPYTNIEKVADIESVDDLMKRATLALEWLHTLDAQNILIVSHGAFGRAMRSLLVKDMPFSATDQLPNAQIVRWV